MVISQVSNDLRSISALLPSKNGAKYLHRLIPRILTMLRASDELVVVNDGSTDNSALLLARYADIDARLKVLTTEGVGLVSALNLGIVNARHPWIARFDVDDEYSLDRINLQRQLIGDDVAVIFSDYTFMSSGGLLLGTVQSAILSNATKLSLVSSQRTPHPVALFNRAKVLSVGGYRVGDFPAEDLGLWLRLTKEGKFLSVPESLLNYRLSGASISSSNRGMQLNQKSRMTADFQNWQELIEVCVQEFSHTTSYYLGEKNSTARIILHLRELSIASNLTGADFSTFKLLVKLPILTLIKVPFVFVDMLAKRISRRLYRSAKTFFSMSLKDQIG